MRGENRTSPLDPAALDERIATETRALSLAAPNLLAEHPPLASISLINGSGERGYARLGERYTRLAHSLEHRIGTETMERYHRIILLHLVRTGHSSLNLPESIRSLLRAECSRMILESESSVSGFYRLSNDLFLKDLGLARGVLLPVGAELVEVNSGLPRRLLLLGGMRQLTRGLHFLRKKLGGIAPLLSFHMDPRNLRDFSPVGWDQTYLRLAELLKLNPEIKGVLGAAWFYDPAMEWVSPHLAYLRRRREEGGAITFRGAADAAAVAGALATSKTRRRLYEEGRYRPRNYSPVWARTDVIRWAELRVVGTGSPLAPTPGAVDRPPEDAHPTPPRR